MRRESGLHPLLELPRDRLAIGAERGEDHDRVLRDELGGRSDQLERGMVAPVEVLEDDQPSTALRQGRAHDELDGRALELLALQVGLVLPLDAQQRSRDLFAPLFPSLQGDRLHQIGDLGPHGLGGIRLLDVRPLLHQSSVLRVGLHRVEGHASPEVPSPIVLRFRLPPRSRWPPRSAGSCRSRDRRRGAGPTPALRAPGRTPRGWPPSPSRVRRAGRPCAGQPERSTERPGERAPDRTRRDVVSL